MTQKRKSGALGKAAFSGAIYTGGAQAFRVVATIVSTIIVARLLTPEDYGVIAMTAPIAAFILLFQNLGLNQAVVQADSLTSEQTNALFWITMAASTVIALIMLALAPAVGLFYDDQRPALVMAASAVTVLITGSSLQHRALLNRDMRFRSLSAIDVSNAAVALLVSFIMALILRNYWALWVGGFAGSVASTIVAWRSSTWRPNRRVSFKGVRELVTFGGHLTGFNVLNFLARNLDNVLIAKVWGPAAVGLYDRSYKLMLFPLRNINQPLSRVVLPILSRVRNEPARYRRVYLLAVRLISLAAVPGVLAAAITSDRLVPLLLGEQWTAATPIFFWLSLAAVTQPVSSSTGWLFMSSGRAKAMFQWSLFAAPLTIVSFLVGLPWGPTGVAMTYFFGQAITIPILYVWSTRGTPVRAFDLYSAMLPTLVGGAMAWGVVQVIDDRLGSVALVLVALTLCYLFGTAIQALSKEGRDAILAVVTPALGYVKGRNAKR